MPLSIPQAITATILFVGTLIAFIAWACCYVGRETVDDAPDHLSYGDIPRIPIGMTPRELTSNEGD
jgi:hypothetical protein